MIITSAHMRTVPYFSNRRGYCVPGARAWAKRYGLDWRRFMREGLPEEELLATGDAFALAVVAHARGSNSRG